MRVRTGEDRSVLDCRWSAMSLLQTKAVPGLVRTCVLSPRSAGGLG